jgi:ATP-dependent helicase/nuclease subunit B
MLELIGLQEDLVGLTCARILENRENNDLSSTAVVFPSKRFGFFLRLELAAKIEGNFFPPALHPVEPFFETLFKLNFPGFRVINEMEASHALYESTLVVFPKGMYGNRKIPGFAAFLPWARKLQAALEEILTEGGRTDNIDWKVYDEFTKLGDYHRPYKEFIQGIPALMQNLLARLRRQRWATKGMTYRDVAELAAAGKLEVPRGKHWIFSGFNAMNACERELFRFFKDQRGAHLILRTDPQALDEPLSPFSLQNETIRALGLERHDPDSSSKWNKFAGKVTIHPCDGVESEVLQAFHILEETCRGLDESGLKKVAVLLPAAPTLIPFVQGAVSRFDQEKTPLPFNITLGYPLERTPMMQLVDSILAVLENADDGKIPSGDYLQLIRHPYVKISGGGGDLEPLKRGVHLLENIINGGNLTRFTIKELDAEFTAMVKRASEETGRELAEEITAQVKGLHQRFIPQGINGIFQLLDFLRRALESVGSKANREAHLFLNEYAATAMEALAELEDFAAAHGEALLGADPHGMAALVRTHFRGRTIRFVGSPLQGVQVMGPLEFRGLSFDEVVVLDAIEGVLPGTAKYDPILPADIRGIFGIRDHSDWEKIYAFNFFSMLGAAKRVHILYPSQGEDGKERGRSRFIERIAFEIEKETGLPLQAVADPLPFSICSRVPGKVEKSRAAREQIGKMKLSPSSLEDYVKCPLRFYFRRVLGLKEREEVIAETENNPIGIIIHDALQNFYKKFPDAGPLLKARQGTLDAELKSIVDAAFRRFTFDPEKGLEKIRAWTIRERLRKFIVEDGERMAAGGIRVESLERDLAIDFPVPGLEAPVPIAGRIDRCEAQGKILRAIDYKTGSSFKLNPGNILKDIFPRDDLSGTDDRKFLRALNGFREKYQGMQLLVYLLFLAQAENKDWGQLDGAYVLLRNKEDFYSPLFPVKDGEPLAGEEKKAVMETFRGDLEAILVDLYTREYFPANPTDERHCSYCPFRLPCGNL